MIRKKLDTFSSVDAAVLADAIKPILEMCKRIGPNYMPDEETIPAGSRILVIDPDGLPEDLIICDEEITAQCAGFGGGLSSDHFIVLSDSKNCFVIGDEPMDITNAKEEQPDYDDWEIDLSKCKEHSPTHVLLHA